MQLKLAVFLGLGCLAGTTQAHFSTGKVVDIVGHVTNISSDVKDALDGGSVFSLVGKLPKIISNVGGIASDVIGGKGGDDDKKKAAFNQKEQLDVCATFKKFAETEEQLIGTIVEKATGVLTKRIPFSFLLSSFFKHIDDVVEKLFDGLFHLVPVCQKQFKEHKETVGGSIGKALHAFSGDCED